MDPPLPLQGGDNLLLLEILLSIISKTENKVSSLESLSRTCFGKIKRWVNHLVIGSALYKTKVVKKKRPLLERLLKQRKIFLI
jgi:hypothetical protein